MDGAIFARIGPTQNGAGRRIAAPSEGLPSEAANIAEIERYSARARYDPVAARELDLIADETFARLASALAQGALDPVQADPSWVLPRATAPNIEHLRVVALERGPAFALAELRPTSPDYQRLGEELARVESEAPQTFDNAGRSREVRRMSLVASLERWRWLPRELPATRVEVWIAQFELALIADGRRTRAHRAIVGARSTQTPSFSTTISAITLNPYWTVPRSILTNELLPRFRRDPQAVVAEGYDVVDSRGRIVQPSDVDWGGRFPYALRQRPGIGNPLGRLKFEMANPYDVYMHDTSNPALFARDRRAFSHGCIRVDEPLELAASVSAGEWNVQNLADALGEGTTRSVRLAAAVPFYAIYMTATVGEDGAVRYADDLYGRDARIVAALDGRDVALAAARAATGCLVE